MASATGPARRAPNEPPGTRLAPSQEMVFLRTIALLLLLPAVAAANAESARLRARAY